MVGHSTNAAMSPRLGYNSRGGTEVPDPTARADTVGAARHASAIPDRPGKVEGTEEPELSLRSVVASAFYQAAERNSDHIKGQGKLWTLFMSMGTSC